MTSCTCQRARCVIPSFGGQRSASLGDSVLGQGVEALLLLEAAGLWYRRSEREDGCSGTALSRNAVRRP